MCQGLEHQDLGWAVAVSLQQFWLVGFEVFLLGYSYRMLVCFSEQQATGDL